MSTRSPFRIIRKPKHYEAACRYVDELKALKPRKHSADADHRKVIMRLIRKYEKKLVRSTY